MLRSRPLPSRDAGFPLPQTFGIARELFAADALHVLKSDQPAVVVVLQTARLVINDLRASCGSRSRDRDELVDLLLVLDHGQRHFGVRQNVGHLLGDGVGIDRHRHGAERLAGAHRPIKPRAVAADDGEFVAALEAEFGEPDREGANLLEHLRPRPGLPDAEVLVAHGRSRPDRAGIVDQKLGQRV